jgi:hypothetical protein
MPAITKRKKAGVSIQNLQRGLSSFTTVSKAATTVQVVLEKNHRVDSKVLAPTKEQPPNARKRKSVDDEEVAVPTVKKQKAASPSKSASELPVPQTPKARVTRIVPESVNKSPRSEASKLFKGLSLGSARTQSFPNSSPTFSSSIEASTPKSFIKSQESLPIELLDLINLYSAFLSTLSIHYAHNGVCVPADLRTLTHDVSRSWGKRKVTIDDIRLIVRLSDTDCASMVRGRGSPKLQLEDYGSGKICVVIQTSGEFGTMREHFNEDTMNDLFIIKIKDMWNRTSNESPAEFIKKLPRQHVTVNSSLNKMSPMLVKGQQRLETLKNDLAAKKEEKLQKIEEKKIAPVKISLLERLRAKQLEQSHRSPGLTKEQAARKSALSRIEDVVAFLAILSTSGSVGQSRVSFTLSTVLMKLKDSSRTPISTLEGEDCLRLLAAEVAPEWVKIAKMGKVEAMVVNRETRLNDSIIRERVKKLQLM